MNWLSSLFGIDSAINNRAGQIADDLVAARSFSVETRNHTIVNPVARSEGEINAAIQGSNAGFGGFGKLSPSQALEVSAAHACGRILASGLAQPSCKILITDENGKREEANDHPLFELLSFDPNPEQTGFEFREQIGLHLAFDQNAYCHKVYSGGRVVALWPLDPRDVTVNRDSNRNITYDVAGVGKGLTSKQIWHQKGMGWQGYIGQSVIELAKQSLGLAKATEAYGSNLFLNGARPGGIVSLTGNPTVEQLEAAATRWNSQYAGSANAHKTAFIGKDVASYTQISGSANEAQWTEARRHQIEEICRAFGVRPSMVYTTGATSYASVEQEFLAHVKFTLGPLHTRFEQSAAKALLTKEERAKGYRIKLNTNGLLRGSVAERMSVINTMVPLGLMTPNEARALEDMPRFDFPEADQPSQAANIFGTADKSEPDEASPEQQNEQENLPLDNEDAE